MLKSSSKIISIIILITILVTSVGIEYAHAQDSFGSLAQSDNSQTLKSLGFGALVVLGVWGIYRRSRKKREARYESNLDTGRYFLDRGDYRLAIDRFEAARSIKDTREVLILLDQAKDEHERYNQERRNRYLEDNNGGNKEEDYPSKGEDEKEGSTVVISKGVSYIEGRDEARARDIAINDGLRRAVEEAVGLYINSQTEVENYQLISDSILKSSEGYVKNYSIVDEYVDRDNYYVELRAEVSLGRLTDDLEALKLNIKRHGNPRIMVIASQSAGYTNISDSIVENQFIRIFLDSGYQVVDEKKVKELVETDKKRAILAGDLSLAAQLGSQLQADIVLVVDGSATYVNLRGSSNNLLTGLNSYHAQVQARAIDTSNARIIGVGTAGADGVGINNQDAATKALLVASKSSGEKIIEDINDSLINSERRIVLQVMGLGDLGQLGVIRRSLPSVDKVNNIYFREYSKGLALFDLDLISGSDPLEFALDLENNLPFAFEVVSLTDGKLILNLID